MNQQIIPGGKLSLIIGPMYSGKSRELINVVKRYAYKKKKIVMVKFNLDNRYSDESKVVTHEKYSLKLILGKSTQPFDAQK
jgi:thymidine kinase